MKKILLLLALTFIVGAVNAKSDKINSDFQSVGNNNISWDSENKKFIISGDESYKGGNNTYQMFAFSAGTLSGCKTIHIPINNYANTRVLFMTGSTTTVTWKFDSNGVVEKTLTEISGLTPEVIATITSIRIAGPATGNSLVETPIEIAIDPADVYLETDEYDETMEINTTITSSSDKDAPFAWSATGTLSTISNNLGKDDSGVIFGYANNNDDAHGSFNVTGYDNVTLNLSEFVSGKNASVRLLKGTGTSNVEFSTASGTLSYTKPLTLTTCASIKAGAGASNCQKVSSVVFTKQYKAYKVEGAPAFNIAASTGSTVAYDRTFPTDKKSTVCLPFALTETEVSDAGTFYELKSVDGTTLTFSPVTTTEAYKPYVFEAKTANPFANLTGKAIAATPATASDYATIVGDYTFQGTLAHQSLPSGVYGYNAANGAFSVTTTNAVTIDAFRGYITAPSGDNARALRCVFGDEITGINEVKSQKTEENDILYSPSGQRVSADYKGIVIKNGRKYFKE